MTEAAEIVQFLFDRIDEDEAIAEGARWRTDADDPLERLEFPDDWLSPERLVDDGGLDEQTAAQIMRWSPNRVALEVLAKRALVERFAMVASDYETPASGKAFADDILRQLARCYAAHPDYQLDWSPRG